MAKTFFKSISLALTVAILFTACKDKDAIEAASVTLNKTALTLNEGESETLTAIVEPTEAEDKTVTWSSSNNSVATVSNGKITAIKEGTATITAKITNNKAATCEVTVQAKEVIVASGTTGSLTWKLTSDSILTISGNGTMTDYSYYGRAPWYSLRESIKTVITEGVTNIGNLAFAFCSNLTSITISNSVTSIGGEAFRACTGLKNITIPNSVISIGGEAFFGCEDLTSVVIPENVISIGDFAFNKCRSLTSITIASSVTSIGWNAFQGCIGLTEITVLATVPPTLISSLGYDVSNTIPVYVPQAYLAAYQEAVLWRMYNLQGKVF